MTGKLVHRLATAADLVSLKGLMTLAIDQLQAGFLSPDQVVASRAIMGLDTQLISDQTYFMVEEEGVLAGCGGWSRSTWSGERCATPGQVVGRA